MLWKEMMAMVVASVVAGGACREVTQEASIEPRAVGWPRLEAWLEAAGRAHVAARRTRRARQV